MSTRSEPRGDRQRIVRAGDRRVFPARIACAGRRPAGHRVIAPLRSDLGQASVELVAFLPLVLLIALAIFSFAAAQAAREEAGAAAEAAALALLQGRDAREAARAALPPASRARARISVSGASVRVHLRPRLPLLANRLAATEEAHAGP
jgi:hypothetical protein